MWNGRAKLPFKDPHCHSILIWLSTPLYDDFFFSFIVGRLGSERSVTPLAICQPDAWTTTFFQHASFVHWSTHTQPVHICTRNILSSKQSVLNNLLIRTYPSFSRNPLEFWNTIINVSSIFKMQSRCPRSELLGPYAPCYALARKIRSVSPWESVPQFIDAHWCSLMSLFESILEQ